MSIFIVMQCGVFVNGIGWRIPLIILDKQRDVLYIVVGTFSVFGKEKLPMDRTLAWTLSLLFLIFLMNILQSAGWFRKEHKRRESGKTAEEFHAEWLQLDEEIDKFRSQLGGRAPYQWTLGESAWYESIRRRESLL